jgi:hypothetical protein
MARLFELLDRKFSLESNKSLFTLTSDDNNVANQIDRLLILIKSILYEQIQPSEIRYKDKTSVEERPVNNG